MADTALTESIPTRIGAGCFFRAHHVFAVHTARGLLADGTLRGHTKRHWEQAGHLLFRISAKGFMRYFLRLQFYRTFGIAPPSLTHK